MYKVGVCVPTLNAGPTWHDWLARTLPAAQGYRVLVIDSSSEDDTAHLARDAGCEVKVIERQDFDHGGTRDWALQLLDDCDIIIFLTQDALVADVSSLQQLVSVFRDPLVGAVSGRQVPHTNASPIAAHARLFNYPSNSFEVSFEDIKTRGIKSAFLSNSFTAYRRQALVGVNGFQTGTILSEDMIAGAQLLKAGWKLNYCAEAQVYHSHNYSLFQEFRRYFDIGVLHGKENWLLTMLGRAEGEGRRFILSEMRYLLEHAPHRIPEAIIRNLLKYTAYKLGRREQGLPFTIKKHLSMHRHYWDRQLRT